MKHFLCAVLLLLKISSLQAQTGKISGRVIDASTQKPLPFANVYVNNTTIGTTTNDSGEFMLQQLPLGASEIVFSFIGYTPQQLRLLVEVDTKSISIQLQPDTRQVSEVSVKASRDKLWEKQVKRFERVFLGNTANCRIVNPWVIDLIEEKGRTIATALIPVEIENKALGYRLFFQLKNVGYSATDYSIVGTIRFEELETADASVARTWTKNRERAYRGSAKHLMKSILDHQLNGQGFLLYREKVKGKPRSRNFSAELEYNLAPRDTTSLVTKGAAVNDYRIAFPEKVEVQYTNEFISNSFYKDVGYPVSWLEVRGGFVQVNKEGTILNPTDVAVSGSMAESRVSGMLPLDYKPGTQLVTHARNNLAAKRLQEQVYLHTDRAYYYPGDNIWFSAYMTYRIPGLMDTLSKVLYVDLIDADRQVSQTRILPIDTGRAAGVFSLPAELKPGVYIVRAYTQWMRNYGIDHFFYKPVQVLNLIDRVDGVAPKPLTDKELAIAFDQPEYKKRAKVKMLLRLDTTGLGERIDGSFSVSVIDETLVLPIAAPMTIKTALSFFEPATESRTPFSYPIEKGITIDGLYKDKKGKGKKAELTLVPENLGGIYRTSTHKSGEFLLTNLTIYDSTKFVVQPSEGAVVVINKDRPNLPEKLPDVKLHLKTTRTPYRVYTGDTLQARILQTVNVRAKKRVTYENSYAQPDVSIKGESIEGYATVADAIAAQLPSFRLVNDQATWYLIWARSSVPNSRDLSAKAPNGKEPSGNGDLASHEPNLYINNVQVVGETAGNRMMQLSPTMIDHIEVNGMITANQGASGSNGLINVFTKRTSEQISKPLSVVNVRGFDHDVPFRSPDYDRPTTNSGADDFRSTLYWNPLVNLTSTQPPVALFFFTSDQAGTYRVVVEGVTSKGDPIHSEAVLTVND
ncbi:hypothetical protein EXU85_19185 [Spirosoma sp. KCTC 42546]|uniref:carboxypeptidase-like regulatory domain-containing protein n=1 Tax=Spirosoma sp. KCTC 42546 TaxID=2520506 RepID=UPI00115AF07A|nr:carboxypeptidase-like regulatory domain-containing protein [Spirosoma sp. KCTC 42546]QDK80616.1 hypothetical protein EXU85_19185 [Spirosoma sp. KCTC 42546]